jgi:hypothetical protein
MAMLLIAMLSVKMGSIAAAHNKSGAPIAVVSMRRATSQKDDTNTLRARPMRLAAQASAKYRRRDVSRGVWRMFRRTQHAALFMTSGLPGLPLRSAAGQPPGLCSQRS